MSPTEGFHMSGGFRYHADCSPITLRIVPGHKRPSLGKLSPEVAQKNLPPQRQRVMDFIRAELDAGRSFPGPAAIADHMGWKRSESAREVLFKLLTYDALLTRSQAGAYSLREATNASAA